MEYLRNMAQAMVVVLLIGLMYLAFRPGKKNGRTRDPEWIKRRLQRENFGRLQFRDSAISVGVGAVLGLASFGTLLLVSNLLMPTDVDFLFEKPATPLGVACVFVGLTLSFVAWFPVAKKIYGKRFRKYLLYSVATNRLDYVRLLKWFFLPALALAVFGALLASRPYVALRGQELIHQRITAFSADRYDLNTLSRFLIADRKRTSGGKVIPALRIILEFEDGRSWTSWGFWSQMDMDRLQELAPLVYGRTGIEPEITDTYPAS